MNIHTCHNIWNKHSLNEMAKIKHVIIAHKCLYGLCRCNCASDATVCDVIDSARRILVQVLIVNTGSEVPRGNLFQDQGKTLFIARPADAARLSVYLRCEISIR